MGSIDDWKPEVGMDVYLAPFNGRRADKRIDKITKVGRHYFYVGDGFLKERFYIESKNQDSRFFPVYHCYRSEEDYKRFLVLQEKRRYIERNIYNLTDEQVVKVYELIT